MLVPPAIPPLTPIAELIENLRSAPAPVREPIDSNIVYSMCTVGDAGRIHDKHLLTALGWNIGTRLDIGCDPDSVVIVHPTEHGHTHMSTAHQFRIPFRQRRITDLNVGDKVLLVAHPNE
ncbi:hypothetical protein DFR70_108352 [Nocardia tenerifensis]|uniref:Uncharacterized protein n=1 Tax=Nocardia tenerifensis TaxID=228006 RepID=A0A318K2T2_9NOCA|nr:hypothetical protein [Nocardia tenerifensis]PXX61794.1 hypothetical protein DFR70_108352 [Nocardia tenerifensis]